MNKAKLLKFMGEVINQKRKALDITQQQLAEFVGLSRVSIMNVERGRHQLQIDVMFKICGLLKCQINELFPPVDAINFKIQEKTVTVKKQKKIRSIKIIKH
jgi:DNA-binding XRE family transcriptional regulator